MKSKKVRHVSIRPADNGGHTVTVEHESPKGRGGIDMYEPGEDHVFGADQHDQMMAHVRSTLGLGEAQETAADEKKESAATQKQEMMTGSEKHKGAAKKAMAALRAAEKK